MKKFRGFSLIELMIVVGIIGILTLIAIPSYQNYTRRARFAEVIATTEVFKTAIALALQQGVPLANIKANQDGIPDLPKPTANLSSLIIESGKILATGTEASGSATYQLEPNSDGSIWKVSGTCLQMGLCHE